MRLSTRRFYSIVAALNLVFAVVYATGGHWWVVAFDLLVMAGSAFIAIRNHGATSTKTIKEN